jgi:hypothetical protein
MTSVTETATTAARPMGRPCRVCTSTDRFEIEQQITSTTPLRTIATTYGIARTSLRYHLAHHMNFDETTVAALGLDAVSVAMRVHAVAERARDAGSDALDRGDTNAAIRAGDAELRALSALTSLGVKHESMVEHFEAARQILSAAGRVARRDALAAALLADEIERGGQRVMADDLRAAIPETKGLAQ